MSKSNSNSNIPPIEDHIEGDAPAATAASRGSTSSATSGTSGEGFDPAGRFRELYSIDCSAHVENKGGFSYLSWPFAVRALRSRCPDANWEVKRFGAEQVPYQKTEVGYFVEVAVTVEGVTLSQIHPVLDNRNKPITQPSPFDINSSIQRCLVKAIALHGLGLSIYGGEDVPRPEDVEVPRPINSAKLAEIERAIEDLGGSKDAFCKALRVKDLSEITEGKVLEQANKMIERKRKSVEAAKAERARKDADTEEITGHPGPSETADLPDV